MKNLVLHIYPFPSEMGKHHCYAFLQFYCLVLSRKIRSEDGEGIQMREAFIERGELKEVPGSGYTPWQPKMKNKTKTNHKPLIKDPTHAPNRELILPSQNDLLAQNSSNPLLSYGSTSSKPPQMRLPPFPLIGQWREISIPSDNKSGNELS
jgi:hypothetical protein